MGSSAWGIFSGSGAYQVSTDATLFSSSLPVLGHEKLKLDDMDSGGPVNDNVSSGFKKLQQEMERANVAQNADIHAIGSMLPDDEDELLAGLTDVYELTGLSHQEELEDIDVFGSLGGLELENDVQESPETNMSKITLSDGVNGNGMTHHGLSISVGTVAGEHPYGEHPSRTLFVRNINSNVEDSELRALFEQYGDIRTMYTACKHRGFVMISYYDIRSARTAMRALQNKPLRRRKLDIHFSIPKDNPSDKDMNQGTLVVFNLDPSVSNDDLRHIFGEYGEVKEIRETPHKRHHKFIEFYDVRAAETALRALNRRDIAGKRIKLEPSRPGGTRRNFLYHLNQELEPDECRGFRHQVSSPLANSSTGNWTQFNSPIQNSPLQDKSVMAGSSMPGLASLLHSRVSRDAPVNINQLSSGHSRLFTGPNDFRHSHSFPERGLSQFTGKLYPSGHQNSNGPGVETVSKPQYFWGSPKLYSELSSSGWPTPSVGHSFTPDGRNHGLPYSGWNGSFHVSSQQHHHHHVGSAPSGIPLERPLGFLQESSKTLIMNPPAFGNMNSGRDDQELSMNMGDSYSMDVGPTIPGKASSSTRMMPLHRLSPVFLGNSLYPKEAPNSLEGFVDRRQSCQIESGSCQMDDKKPFQLNLDKILRGDDTRTTLMIKNIPNKYTSKMLLTAIDKNNKGTYDFLYLPIDFKNKCNVGYAFINVLSPSHIIPLYQAFNGKKWEKFNSEKVASLAYARIQGKNALLAHFQNSSLMNEDKRCRPILFHQEASQTGEEIVHEHFPSGGSNLQVHQLNMLQGVDSRERSKGGGSGEKLGKG